MKRKEVNQIQNNQPQTNQGGFLSAKIDKMSLPFVLPMVLFFAVVGLLLILLAETVTDVASWALAIGLVALGGWLLLRYFRSELKVRISGTDLAVGLILLLAGVLLMCSPSDLDSVFPKIWGLSLLFGAFLKIQYAFDEKSVGVKRWWIMLIFAGVSLAIGILTLMNKSVFGDNQYLVIGIFMIGEAVLDMVTYFLITRGVKKQNTDSGTAPVAAAAQEAPVPAALQEGNVPEGK